MWCVCVCVIKNIVVLGLRENPFNLPSLICTRERWWRFSLLCVAVSERFRKTVACPASGALGGKGNVALCLESEMVLHASQHVSSPPTHTPTNPSHSPAVLPPTGERHPSLCELNFLLVLSRTDILIEGSSSGKVLFLAAWPPTSCLCVLFICFCTSCCN